MDNVYTHERSQNGAKNLPETDMNNGVADVERVSDESAKKKPSEPVEEEETVPNRQAPSSETMNSQTTVTGSVQPMDKPEHFSSTSEAKPRQSVHYCIERRQIDLYDLATLQKRDKGPTDRGMAQYRNALGVLLVAFITLQLFNIIPFPELICQYELPRRYICKQPPPFEPVFEAMVSNTSLLIDALLDLKTPASSSLMHIRPTAHMLVQAVQDNSDKLDNADVIADYLEAIGETTYDMGNELEKVYSKGSWAFDALAREIDSLGSRLSSGPELPRMDVEYVAERYRKVIDVIERLRQQIINCVHASEKAAKTLTGEGFGLLKGLPDVITYFDGLDQERSEFDLGALKRDIEHMKPTVVEVRRTKEELSNAASSLKKRRLDLIAQRDYLNGYYGNASVTDTDVENVRELVERLRSDKPIFVSKDERVRVQSLVIV